MTANAILRAPDAQGRPVSCANDTSSSTWPWRYIRLVNKSITTHTGCEDTPSGEVPTTESTDSNDSTLETATGNFSISSSGTSNHGTTVEVGLEFAYQAAESFDINISYSGSITGGPDVDSASVTFSDSEAGGGASSGSSLSGSITRTLPASVVPASYSATLNASIGIEFPEDVCSVSGGSADASATLGLEFLD